MENTPWHSMTVDETFEKLATSEAGLTEEEVQKRQEQYGSNEFAHEKQATKLAVLISQFKNPLMAVLIIAAAISLIVDHQIDAIVIAAVVILNAGIGFFQEYKAETALQALKSLAGPETKVTRRCPKPEECREVKIKAKDIVPGDVISLEAGDKVPADARIFQAINLEVDESMLTGESLPTAKSVEPVDVEAAVADRGSLVFSGTIIVQGRGKAVVVETGTKTEIGKIATLIRETERVETPIQKRTKNLSRVLGLLALVASVFVFVIATLRGFDVFETFLFALATAVSAIPEGLPAVLTVTLAVGVNRMAKRNALIRKLQAVDTLGSATVICTDKTGTLTTNQMTVRKVYVDNQTIDVSGEGFTPEGKFTAQDQQIDPAQHEALQLILQIGALCNDSELVSQEKDGRTQWKIKGDPTEGALVVVSQKAGQTKKALEEKQPRIDEIPFDSKTRFMATFHRGSEGKLWVYAKGAPEAMFALCSHFLENGKVNELTEEAKGRFLEVSTGMASDALRTLAMAYQTIDPEKLGEVKEDLKNNKPKLVFMGLQGMIDPPRSEAKKAVEICKQAGIRVVMATGDHKLTAQAIAKELQIATSDEALTGADIDKLSDPELDKALAKTSVFARVSPTHKYRIVESLRRQGHVVAMTGDGVNDAPALKVSEIGIAMGITGTDVTKETADMVLTDDNFASIVNAIEEGRVIFENIRKVVKYLISTNTGEIITILAALILLPNAPLIFTAVQILWINLVTDGLLVIPLAMEPKEANVMAMPPKKPNAPIINRDVLFSIVFVGVFMAVGSLWFFTQELDQGNVVKAQTFAFVTIALFQVFNSLNCRSQRLSVFKLGVFKNKYLLLAIAAAFILQVMATELPPLQVALGTASLSLLDWTLVIIATATIFIGDEIRKLLMYRRH